jgi:dihydroorotase
VPAAPDSLLLFNARLVDAVRDAPGALLFSGSRIAAVFEGNFSTPESCRAFMPASSFDARGLTAQPAFVDLHAHFRYPGQSEKETLESALRAAKAGGYGTLVLMPNTSPPVSDYRVALGIQAEAAAFGLADVLQSVTVTRAFSGDAAGDISHLDALPPYTGGEGLPLVSNDGHDVDSAAALLAALRKCAPKGIVVACHSEDAALAREARALREQAFRLFSQQGDWFAPCPEADSRLVRANELFMLAEDVATSRNLLLADFARCRVHICHTSTARSLQAVRRAKQAYAARGEEPLVSCEITPHHLSLAAEGENLRHIVNPPLRPEADRAALIESLADSGAFAADAIATDHAPHTARDKLAGAPGFPGLETAYAACNTALVASGRASASRLSALMSANPARILGLDRGAFPKGRLSPGFAADVVLVDPAERWTVDAAGFCTKGKGSPFAGKTLTGRVKAVFRRGVLL